MRFFVAANVDEYHKVYCSSSFDCMPTNLYDDYRTANATVPANVRPVLVACLDEVQAATPDSFLPLGVLCD